MAWQRVACGVAAMAPGGVAAQCGPWRRVRPIAAHQDFGLLLLEGQDLVDERLVGLSGARDEGAVELLAHRAVLDELHRRHCPHTKGLGHTGPVSGWPHHGKQDQA